MVANTLSPYEIKSCKFKATHTGTNTSILDIGEGLVCESTVLVLGRGPVIWLAFKNIHSTKRYLAKVTSFWFGDYGCGAKLLSGRCGQSVKEGHSSRGVDLLIYFPDSHS